MRITHQQVIVTRSQWWWSTRGGNDENDAPTSHRDSLVVLAVDTGWIVLYTISKMTQRNMKKKKLTPSSTSYTQMKAPLFPLHGVMDE